MQVCTLFVEVFECPQVNLYLPPLPLGTYFHVTKNTVQARLISVVIMTLVTTFNVCSMIAASTVNSG